MKNKRNQNILFLLLMTAIISFAQAAVCSAQDLEKSILPQEYIEKKRPVKKASAAPKATAKKRVYRKRSKLRPSTPKPRVAPAKLEEAMLGLTVWKMRPASEDDEVKELIEERSGCKIAQPEYTWARNESETPLEVCDRIRLSIESLSLDGYLYVVNRELYDDGTYSSPKLVYPTLRSARRNVPISAGNSIFIPESGNRFLITPKQFEKKQAAEVLTVIISPKPLIEQSMLKKDAIDLPRAQFANWLNQWEVETVVLEQEDGAGEAITQAEQTAGEAAKGLTEESSLTRDDPAPQSIYRALIKRGDPFLVNVFLKFNSK